MSRSGYYDGGENNWSLIRWRGAVASAIRGCRGQAFLKEMLEAMESMPKRELIAGELVKEGQVCAIGSVMVKRGIDTSEIDVDDYESIAKTLGVSEALVREIEYVNDEHGFHYGAVSAEQSRFMVVHDWIEKNIASGGVSDV